MSLWWFFFLQFLFWEFVILFCLFWAFNKLEGFDWLVSFQGCVGLSFNLQGAILQSLWSRVIFSVSLGFIAQIFLVPTMVFSSISLLYEANTWHVPYEIKLDLYLYIHIENFFIVNIFCFIVTLQLGAYMTQFQMPCCASTILPAAKKSLDLHICFQMED